MDADRDPTPAAESWWGRRSLRTRLTVATAVVLAVGMVLAAGILVWWVHRSLIGALDAAVIQQAQSVAASVEAGRPAGPLPEAGDGSPLVQVVQAGRVVAQSGDAKGTTPLFTFTGAEDPVLTTVTATPDADADDGQYRVAAVTATSSAGTATVYAALPMAPVAASTTALITALAVGVPVLVAALAALSWVLIGRALRPVELLRRQAAAIPATDLHRRLRAPAAKDDLGRLATTFNDLLARIEASADRQRRFIADAAHELRSPIASLRAQLEVAERHPQLVAEPERVRGLLADTQRLALLTDDLLALARLDSAPRVERRPVDLDDLVLTEVRRLRDRGTHIVTTQVHPGRVMADPAGVVRIVRNLLDNAVRHADAVVQVSVHADTAQVTLVVADDGPGIGVDDRERVFERFTRLDDARTRDAGGAGLGLAIVRAVALSHDGTVRLEDASPGARFVVTLPAAP